MWLCISERHDITNKEQVEQIQKIYVDALSEYLEKKRLHSGTCLAKLLVRLSDLRTISIEHSKMLTMMHMDEALMPHIVQDIYIQNSWEFIYRVQVILLSFDKKNVQKK